jgi:hypothetical protein
MVKTSLECPARMVTPIQFPAVLFEVNASVDDVVVPASLLVCSMRVIAAAHVLRERNTQPRTNIRHRCRVMATSRRKRRFPHAESGKNVRALGKIEIGSEGSGWRALGP